MPELDTQKRPHNEYVRDRRSGRLFMTLLWPLPVVMSAVTIVAAIPLRFKQLRAIRPDAALTTGQLNLQSAASLAELGLTVTGYAGVVTFLEGMGAILALLVGAFIFWRRSHDPVVFFFALALVTFGLISSPLVTALQASARHWQVIVLLLRQVGLLSLMIAFLRFPDGRFVPGWSRWLALGWLAYLVISLFVPSLRFTSSLIITNRRQATLLAWALVWLGLIVVLQLYRYRYHATGEQRQQTKWVVFGLVVAFGLSTLLSLPLLVLPSLHEPTPLSMAMRVIAVGIILLGQIFLCLTVAVAILRFRLYDLDVIVNRTLVYTLLTGALILVYLITIIILQSFLPARGEIATVLSTLAVATAFTPLRRRIQRLIDRRFYRSKYDAARTLAKFAVTARDEVDLQTIAGELTGAVSKTMQPAHVSLWLAPMAESAGGEVGERSS